MTEDTPHLSAVPAVTSARGAEPEVEGEVETVPDHVRDAARRVFAERETQAEVLPLTYDSLLGERVGDGPRRLTFGEPGGPIVEVTVRPSSPADGVGFEVTAVGCSLVEVRCGDAVLAVDPPGRTQVGPVPHGLFSAVLEGGGNRRLRTAWVRV